MKTKNNKISTNFETKVLNIKKVLGYQKNSVVSQEIVNKKIGTITLFAFDKGQGLSEHTAPFDALVHIVDGEAIVKIAEKNFFVKKDEMILMPANIPHALKAIKKFKMILIMIKSKN